MRTWRCTTIPPGGLADVGGGLDPFQRGPVAIGARAFPWSNETITASPPLATDCAPCVGGAWAKELDADHAPTTSASINLEAVDGRGNAPAPAIEDMRQIENFIRTSLDKSWLIHLSCVEMGAFRFKASRRGSRAD